MRLNKGAFSGCSGLTSITIGSGVTSIGYWAFAGCTSLTSVTINSSIVPSLDSYAFIGNSSVIIYVPADMIETYKADAQWSKLTIEVIK